MTGTAERLVGPVRRATQYRENKEARRQERRQRSRANARVEQADVAATGDPETWTDVEIVDELPEADESLLGRQIVVATDDEDTEQRALQLVQQLDGSLQWRDLAPKAGVWPAQYVSSWGGIGSGNGQFNSDIRGIAVDADGNVYVSSDNKVQKFSANGTYLTTITSSGSGNGQVNTPGGLAILGSVLFVVDTGNNRIQRFALPAGTYLSQFSNINIHTLNTPLGIALTPTGYMLVSNKEDATHYELILAKPDLSLVPTSYSGSFDMYQTFGLLYPDTSTIITALPGRNEIEQRRGQIGNGSSLLWRVGTAGAQPGQFAAPFGLASDLLRNIYITDTGNHRVQVVNRLGFLQGSFGSAGSGAGQFDRPTAICVTPDYIYVADSGNRRVQIWTNPAVLDTRYPQIVGWTAVTWDPANVGAGSASSTFTATIDGADPTRDIALFAFSGRAGLARMRLDCWVSGADTVSYQYANDTAGAQNYPSGVLIIIVVRPPGL